LIVLKPLFSKGFQRPRQQALHPNYIFITLQMASSPIKVSISGN
jgi:hypothetical protein